MAEELIKKKVFIVDDHPIIRHGLTQLINQEEDLITCGEAEDGPQVMEAIEKLNPDIVLVDISLMSSNGLDLVVEIRGKYADLPLLMLTMHDETLYAERALRAGAQGYVMKQDPPEKVIEAIRRVLKKEIYLSESMTIKMLKKVAGGSVARKDSPAEVLSSRELEIFKLIGQGTGTREIAKKLDVSVKTVDAHRANMKKKLELKSGTELVQMAIKWVLTRESG